MLAAAGWVVQDARAVEPRAPPGRRGPRVPAEAAARLRRLPALRRRQGRRRGRGEEGGRDADRRRGAVARSTATGCPTSRRPRSRPLPFLYESTGVETRFTNRSTPSRAAARSSRSTSPETLAGWLDERIARHPTAPTLRHRAAARCPPLDADRALAGPDHGDREPGAVAGGEPAARADPDGDRLGQDLHRGRRRLPPDQVRRRARVLFLVDRANLGRQTLKEFQQFSTPDDGRKFTELYNVQHLRSNKLDPVARVVDHDHPAALLDAQGRDRSSTRSSTRARPSSGAAEEPVPVEYNPAFPIETFDVIFIDECHRSIYNLWRQVLEYFDAFLDRAHRHARQADVRLLQPEPRHGVRPRAGRGRRRQRRLRRLPHPHRDHRAAARRSRPGIVDAIRDRQTRAHALGAARRRPHLRRRRSSTATWSRRTRSAPSSETFRDKLFTEIFPGRTEVPKTLIFAKDDATPRTSCRSSARSSARATTSAQKITYKATGRKTDDLIAAFRNCYNPRIAVTVDMIATGTDVKPLEFVFFMRAVKSRTFFEQMKGRGVRVIADTTSRPSTPDATAKKRFVIVDAVGVTETELSETPPLERQPTVPFEKLLRQVVLRQPRPGRDLVARRSPGAARPPAHGHASATQLDRARGRQDAEGDRRRHRRRARPGPPARRGSRRGRGRPSRPSSRSPRRERRSSTRPSRRSRRTPSCASASSRPRRCSSRAIDEISADARARGGLLAARRTSAPARRSSPGSSSARSTATRSRRSQVLYSRPTPDG